MDKKINTSRFYFEYKGHTIPDLFAFHNIATSLRPARPIVYLAGDSSLDNKYWLPSNSPATGSLPVTAPEIYKAVLERPYPKADVAFWLNHHLGTKATALNLAVEASLLRERKKNLLEHDEFIRDHIGPDDFLVVSVGANDIAMKPTFSTIFHMMLLAWLTPMSSIRNGTAWGLGYFIKMFKSQVELYISKMVEKQKPRAVIVCMIYFPLEAEAASQKGWADLPLRALGYNRSPIRLQTVIAKMYELATQQIKISGVNVIPFPLFETLDGKDGGDYVERVEPSVEGGRKMASQLTAIIDPMIGGSE